jgi:hypothetical protein
MKLGEPRRVLRQSTSVFETSNLSTLLSYKQPLQDGNIMERNQSARQPKQLDSQAHALAMNTRRSITMHIP